MQGNEQAAERPEKQAHETRKHLIRAALLVGWGLVLAVQISATMSDPTVSNLIVSAAFCLLFLIVNINLFVIGWLGSRSWRRVSSKLHGAAYLSEFHRLGLAGSRRRHAGAGRSQDRDGHTDGDAAEVARRSVPRHLAARRARACARVRFAAALLLLERDIPRREPAHHGSVRRALWAA